MTARPGTISDVSVSFSPTGIDDRAAIHPSAVIGEDCVLGPFAVVGAGVVLGKGCVVHPHAVIEGPSFFGDENEFHPFSCVGGAPQDLRHSGEPTELCVGSGNSFRENVTVHRGTVHGGGLTRIGDDNLLMAYSHVAHDCSIGNRVVLANGTTLAGHVMVQDHAVFGGCVSVGTFLRIGESSMSAAGAMIEKDVPPYCLVAGDRARLRALNRVGMKRRGFDGSTRSHIKKIFLALKDPNITLAEIVGSFNDTATLAPESSRMLDFIATAGRGLCR